MDAITNSRTAPIASRSLVNAGNEFESQVFEQHEPSQAESDRRYAAALASDLRARGEVYSASLLERMQRQIDGHNSDDVAVELGMARGRLMAAREEIVRLKTEDESLRQRALLSESVANGLEELEEMLKDEKHFVTDVVDDVASVMCRESDSRHGADGFSTVDVSSSLTAIPFTVEWEHEFLCDGGFNRYVTAQIEFRLVRVEQSRYHLLGGRVGPNTGMSRLFYAVAIRQ